MNLLARLIRRDRTAADKSQTSMQLVLQPPLQSSSSSNTSSAGSDQYQNRSQSPSAEGLHDRDVYYTSSTLVQAGKRVFAEMDGVLTLSVMDWKNHLSSVPVQEASQKLGKDKSVATALICHSLLRYLASLSSAPFLREIIIATNNSTNLIMPLISDQFVTDDGNYWLLHLELDPVQTNLPMIRERISWWTSNLN